MGEDCQLSVAGALSTHLTRQWTIDLNPHTTASKLEDTAPVFARSMFDMPSCHHVRYHRGYKSRPRTKSQRMDESILSSLAKVIDLRSTSCICCTHRPELSRANPASQMQQTEGTLQYFAAPHTGIYRAKMSLRSRSSSYAHMAVEYTYCLHKTPWSPKMSTSGLGPMQ